MHYSSIDHALLVDAQGPGTPMKTLTGENIEDLVEAKTAQKIFELKDNLDILHKQNETLHGFMQDYLDSGKPHLRSIKTPAEFLDKYIELLHRYNDAKDFGQFLLGKLALLKQCTVSCLYSEFGLDTDD